MKETHGHRGFRRQGNERNRNRDIEIIELGNKQIPIEKKMADIENNKAVK